MEGPYTIASLPRPLDSVNGKTQATPVYGLRGSRKRKRHEVAVGVDGEGINIYNIQTQGLLAAYAIPPHTYLCCPPSSYHSPPTEANPAQRDTFVVLRDGFKSPGRRLVRFTERSSARGEFATPAKSELEIPEGEVLGVQALVSPAIGGSRSAQALITYADGENVCVSHDLSESLWNHSIIGPDEYTDARVEHVSVVDLNTARKGILRSRDDLLASFDTSGTSTLMLACFLIRSSDSIVLRICSLDTVPVRAGLQRLDDLRLPGRDVRPSEPASWELTALSGQLFMAAEGAVRLYDLSGIAPQHVLTIKDNGGPIESFVGISSSAVVTVAGGWATLYETKYGSIQASTPLKTAFGSEGDGRKRKRDGDAQKTSQFRLLCSYSDLGIVAALSTELSGLQLGPELRIAKRGRSRGSLLSDVLWKGAVNHIEPPIVNGQVNGTVREARAKKRNDWRAEVDQLAEAQDTVALENIVAKTFHVSREPDEEARNQDPVNGDMQNELIPDNDQLWDFGAGLHDLGPHQRQNALHILGKVFGVGSASDGLFDATKPLGVRITSRNIIRWLAITETLSPANLTNLFGVPVASKDIAQALGAANGSFELLYDVLDLPIHLPLPFVVESLGLLIRSLDTPTSSSDPASGPTDGAVDHAPNADDDADLDLESRTAELELSHALAALESGLELRSASMRHVFARLHAFPRAALTAHLRRGLRQRDLVFFIHVLRIELADAGWTERYVDAGSDAFADAGMLAGAAATANPATVGAQATNDRDEAAAPSDRAIRTIGDLLAAAVDAIGAAGWLVGGAGDADSADPLLEALRAEVSASLEGVYEAHALSGYLGEFERFAEGGRQRGDGPRGRRANGAGGVGAVVGGVGGDGAMMPVGGRKEPVSAAEGQREQGGKGKGKGKGKGGHVAKARARVTAAGLYEFERIRV